MSSYYYLISSLSTPILGERPQLTLEKFINACSDWVSESEYQELVNVSLIPDFEKISKNSVVNQWKNWETCLKNRIAVIRAGNLNKEATNYTLEEKDFFSEIERGVQEAFSAASPMAKEKMLDELRWTELDNLESGHQFDLSILCIYKLRLMLCEKWLNREVESGEKNLDTVLLKFYTPEKNEEDEETL